MGIHLGGRNRARFIPNPQVLLDAITELKSSALEETTSVKSYAPNWKLYLQFCHDSGRSPDLTGKDKSKDEDTLLNYVAFEFKYHQNKFTTIRTKLYAIRWYTMAVILRSRGHTS